MAFIGRAGKKYLIYLLWGFLAAIPMLFFIYVYPGFDTTSPFYCVTVSPLLEEFFKALPIIIPAIIGIKNNDKDLLVCAMASGIGFSVIENLIVLNANPDYSIPIVIIRSFSTSLLHGCTCGIIGYGIVLIRNFDRHALPTLLFGFYTIAVTIHAIFNLLFLKYSMNGGIIIDLVFPVFLFFFLHACYHVDVPILFKKNPAL